MSALGLAQERYINAYSSVRNGLLFCNIQLLALVEVSEKNSVFSGLWIGAEEQMLELTLESSLWASCL